jgi:UDP-N-acetylmuramate--alanine ligase
MIDIDKAKKFFILGIKGVAMTNLAIILTRSGKEVFGWDVEEKFITDEILKKYKIKFINRIDAHGFKTMTKDVDMVIYSAAHGGINNPILKLIDNKIPRIHQAQMIGQLMKKFKIPLAVAGSHGKTTTSALLSFALIKLGKKPSYIVGTSRFGKYAGADYSHPWETDYFIAEADEYGLNPPKDKTPKFYFLNPKFVIATNIDFDHPDVFKNLEMVKAAFKNFFNQKKIIGCGDNIALLSVLKKMSKKNYLTYGFKSINDYQIKNYRLDKNGSIFLVKFPNRKTYQFKIKIFGLMNITNATGVIGLLDQLGFSPKQIAYAIKDFAGAKRRFEKIYEDEKITIFDDYAHHPEEIKATIEAARLRFPKKRIIVIFQPHTFSRTQELIKEFNQALSKADTALILPIFPSARENPKNFNLSSLAIVKADQHNKNLFYLSNEEELLNEVKKIIQKGDIIFTMGAGNVYQLGKKIVNLINDY